MQLKYTLLSQDI